RLPPNLDATALAPEEVEIAFVVDAPEIAGQITRCAGLPRFGRKRGRVELGAPPISGTDVSARYDERADFVGLRFASVFAHDPHGEPLRAATDRKNPAGAARARVLDDVLGNDVRFGCGQVVDEDAALERMSPKQLDVA